MITNDPEAATEVARFASLGYGLVGAGPGSSKIDRRQIAHPSFKRHVSLGFNYRSFGTTAPPSRWPSWNVSTSSWPGDSGLCGSVRSGGRRMRLADTATRPPRRENRPLGRMCSLLHPAREDVTWDAFFDRFGPVRGRALLRRLGPHLPGTPVPDDGRGTLCSGALSGGGIDSAEPGAAQDELRRRRDDLPASRGRWSERLSRLSKVSGGSSPARRSRVRPRGCRRPSARGPGCRPARRRPRLPRRRTRRRIARGRPVAKANRRCRRRRFDTEPAAPFAGGPFAGGQATGCLFVRGGRLQHESAEQRQPAEVLAQEKQPLPTQPRPRAESSAGSWSARSVPGAWWKCGTLAGQDEAGQQHQQARNPGRCRTPAARAARPAGRSRRRRTGPLRARRRFRRGKRLQRRWRSRARPSGRPGRYPARPVRCRVQSGRQAAAGR